MNHPNVEHIVTVNASSSYDILIGKGILSLLGDFAKAVIRPGKAVLVTDDTVNSLYGDIAEDSLAHAGYTVFRFVFPHGEASKNAETYLSLLQFCIENGLTRSDALFALGGGVVGDITGFAAATLLRGVRFVQIPTTLLAAVDSSVGGKTGIDLPSGKNLVGAFWQPSLVLCDYSLLDTLPKEILADGSAEVIKYAVINDPTLFRALETRPLREQLGEVIAVSVRHKRDIVERDERDTGCRQLLNLGHTVGHAIESCSSFSISHGSAVAIGMNIVASASKRRGLLPAEALFSLRELLKAYHLPITCDFSAEELYAVSTKDKKRSGQSITLVVPYDIGDTRLYPLPVSDLLEFIADGLTEMNGG